MPQYPVPFGHGDYHVIDPDKRVPCAPRVAPPVGFGPREARMRNILLATDLTARCETAFHRAVQLARQTGAMLHILHVAPLVPLPELRRFGPTPSQTAEENITAMLHRLPDSVRPNFRSHVMTHGRISDRVVEWADLVGADLVVLGKRESTAEAPAFGPSILDRVLTAYRGAVLLAGSERRLVHHVLVALKPRRMLEGIMPLVAALGLAPHAHVLYRVPDRARGRSAVRAMGRMQFAASKFLLRCSLSRVRRHAFDSGIGRTALHFRPVEDGSLETVSLHARETHSEIIVLDRESTRPAAPAFGLNHILPTGHDILFGGI